MFEDTVRLRDGVLLCQNDKPRYLVVNAGSIADKV